jgi:hypothetical protein
VIIRETGRSSLTLFVYGQWIWSGNKVLSDGVIGAADEFIRIGDGSTYSRCY